MATSSRTHFRQRSEARADPRPFVACVWCGNRTPAQPPPNRGAADARLPRNPRGQGVSNSRGVRHAVAEILENYPASDVNWSGVARRLGVSRQAVHQVVHRLLSPVEGDEGTLASVAFPVPLHPSRQVRERRHT